MALLNKHVLGWKQYQNEMKFVKADRMPKERRKITNIAFTNWNLSHGKSVVCKSSARNWQNVYIHSWLTQWITKKIYIHFNMLLNLIDLCNRCAWLPQIPEKVTIRYYLTRVFHFQNHHERPNGNNHELKQIPWQKKTNKLRETTSQVFNTF